MKRLLLLALLPSLAAAQPTCQPEPLPGATLYMRGTLGNWNVLEDYAFQYSCDAYYLNIKASGRHEFKIADAAWSPARTFGERGGNFVQVFGGEHTLKLAFDGSEPRLTVGPKTFVDPNAPPVTDPVALSLRFDSRDATFKSPFGAVPAGTTVRYAVSALPGVQSLTLVVETRRLEGNQDLLAYTEIARVPLVRGDDGRWRTRFRYDAVAVHGHWFEAQIGGQRYVLQNNEDAIHWTREKGAGGRAEVAVLPQQATRIRRFRQTVHDPAFRVPAWAADAVYYQIFPERFRNGDPRNDPKPGITRYQNHTVERHANWNERPFKPGSGDGSDAVFNNDFYGGDLAGITQKLGVLQDLGINTLYLTPIFKAASNHKYDTADYRVVDPGFGSNADFQRLVREAKKRGIRVLPDSSFNHSGSDSIYFNRFGNFGTDGAFQNGRINPASPYARWYSFDATQQEPDKQFKGWVGVLDLPELNKADPGLRRFFYGPGGVTQQWLDLGAAGWRMDVAPWVPDDFWREWRRAVKKHRPDAITVAETWFDASKHLLGDMFDSTMNYIFRNAVLDHVSGGPAADLVRNLEHVREAYPPQVLPVLMNLIGSHDQARVLHVFGWHEGTADAAVIARAKARLKLATFFQMTYPGAPSIYYGDEVGVTGGDDPLNRATYPWPDLGGQPDEALRTEFKRLIRLRHENAVLRHGDQRAPLFVDEHVLVQVRRLGGTWALVATNNADAPRRVTLDLPFGSPVSGWRDALAGGETLDGGAARRIEIELPPLGGRVLIAR